MCTEEHGNMASQDTLTTMTFLVICQKEIRLAYKAQDQHPCLSYAKPYDHLFYMPTQAHHSQWQA